MSGDQTRESTPKREGCLDVTIKILKATFRAIKSSFGLFCLLLIYTALGGYMFSSLESTTETEEVLDMNKTRQQFLNDLFEAAQHDNWTVASGQLLTDYEEAMYEFFLRGRSPEKQETWTMLGAVIYCITVYTTIGYGHIAPVTTAGRIATVFYALIGIPLCLMVLADMGRLLTRLIKGLITVVRLYYYRGHLKRIRQTKAVKAIEKTLDMKDDVDTKELETDVGEEFNFPVPLAVAILLLYLLGCAAIYNHFEDWTYTESVYFLFISVSTIGFGDMVPRAEDQQWFLLSTLVVFIGLSLVSMIINVLIDFITSLMKQAKQKVAEEVNKMGEAIGLDLHLGDDESNKSEGTPEEPKAPKAQSEDLSSPGSKSPEV